jgi:hypothetical protein|tara:strand:+ start:2348 stop:3085 length:738 start_codon:yes stop_codon:yes gene_type:complete
MTEKSSKKEIVSKTAAMFEEDAGGGLENVTPEDLIIPQLKIAQKTNKEVDENDGAYITGLQVGDIMNNITGEIYRSDKGIAVIPIAYKRVFLEFRTRDEGGGFIALHENPGILSETTRTKGLDLLPSGNYIQTTANHYVLLIEDGKAVPVMIAMSSTQLKKSRRWLANMTSIRMTKQDGGSYTPPSYSHTYQMTTVPEKNDKGSWYGWKIDLVGEVEDVSLYTQAKSFAASVNEPQLTESEDVPF